MGVESVAVQNAGTMGVFVRSAPVETQFTAAPSVVEPLENCTVPVGPSVELLVVETVAVNITVPPEVITLGLAATPMVVVACIIVTERGLDVPAL